MWWAGGEEGHPAGEVVKAVVHEAQPGVAKEPDQCRVHKVAGQTKKRLQGEKCLQFQAKFTFPV